MSEEQTLASRVRALEQENQRLASKVEALGKQDEWLRKLVSFQLPKPETGVATRILQRGRTPGPNPDDPPRCQCDRPRFLAPTCENCGRTVLP